MSAVSWFLDAIEDDLTRAWVRGEITADQLEDRLERARREGVMPTTPPEGGT